MDNSCEILAVPVFNVKQASLFYFTTYFFKEHKILKHRLYVNNRDNSITYS